MDKRQESNVDTSYSGIWSSYSSPHLRQKSGQIGPRDFAYSDTDLPIYQYILQLQSDDKTIMQGQTSALMRMIMVFFFCLFLSFFSSFCFFFDFLNLFLILFISLITGYAILLPAYTGSMNWCFTNIYDLSWSTTIYTMHQTKYINLFSLSHEWSHRSVCSLAS